ncbi:hypothetical protein PAPYR_714 [Paratrimastix pyriformis]|uniref:CCT domain-containing protein n=1 Tax=Paratrimastix pyriformis TaxID=342808 RepID=A0ABQ8UUA5_9EUKA|nr:hypothetical protein PAPYR_714 [Paratrimastix pyriformis]
MRPISLTPLNTNIGVPGAVISPRFILTEKNQLYLRYTYTPLLSPTKMSYTDLDSLIFPSEDGLLFPQKTPSKSSFWSGNDAAWFQESAPFGAQTDPAATCDEFLVPDVAFSAAAEAHSESGAAAPESPAIPKMTTEVPVPSSAPAKPDVAIKTHTEISNRPTCVAASIQHVYEVRYDPLTPAPVQMVGKYTFSERARKIAQFLQLRRTRTFSKKIRYGVRKEVADRRKREKGRFAKETH